MPLAINPENGFSRREFIKSSTSAAVVAASAPSANFLFSQAQDKIKVGVVGCGGRGTGAAGDCAKAYPGVEIYALGDLFPDRLKSCAERIQKSNPNQVNVPEERRFTGFDCYEKVLASGIDMVILAAPPGFRPTHFKAAVAAGKHIFCEKPVCVDATGYHTVVTAAEQAAQKKLCVVAGTQRRHQGSYVETVKMIREGAIGDIVAGQVYWIGGPVHHKGEQAPGMSDIEFHCRNWYNWTWLCGDHIVEQHIHNIDVMHWVMGGPPIKCIGMGGRQTRQEKGNIFDHFAIEYEYPNNVRIASYCAHIDKIKGRVSEQFVGTKGMSDCANKIWGEKVFAYSGENINPYVKEHMDLIASMTGKAPYVNEAKQVANSTLIAIMGRTAAYAAKEVTWKWITEESKLDLMPPKFEFTSFQPHGVPVPGQMALV
jgi:predicted dehydrogenase